MSIEFKQPPENEGEKSKRGGKREGSGRVADDVKECRALASRVVNYFERVAVAKGGKEWAMTKEEKELINEPLGEIFVRWDLRNLDSPYLALPAAMYFYAYTEKRASHENTGTWISKKWAAWKDGKKAKAAKKVANVE